MGADLPDWWSRVQAVMELEFIKLVDTPSTYSGHAGQVPKVADTEDALDWSEAAIDAHATRHEEGGGDTINLANIDSVPAALTTHTATKTGVHGTGTNFVAETSVEDIDLAAHKARHQNYGDDEISLAGLDGEPITLTIHKNEATGVHGVGSRYIAETSVAYVDYADHSARHAYAGADEINLAGLDGEPAALTAHTAAKIGVHGVGTNYVAETSVEDIDLAAHKTRHQAGGGDELNLAGLAGEPATLTTHKDLKTGVHGTGTKYVAETSVEDIDLAAHKTRHEAGGGDALTAIADSIITDAGRFELRANRDVASGYPILDAAGGLQIKGNAIYLNRDGSNDIYLIERATGEGFLRVRRAGANSYVYYHKAGGYERLALDDTHWAADDHTQYLNTARHDTPTRHPLNTVVDITAQLPWRIDIDLLSMMSLETNWSTVIVSSSALYNGYRQSPGNLNDEIAWWVVLATGTWYVGVHYIANFDCGIASIQFDDVEKGTIDMYCDHMVYNVLTGLGPITVSTSGRITLKIKMTSKNPNSSDYFALLQHVHLVRTA